MIDSPGPVVRLLPDAVLRAVANANPETARGVAANAEWAADAAGVIAAQVAYDTGAYERSIKSARIRRGPEGPESAIQAGGRRAFYAHIIEWGSAKHAPHAVLRRAAAQLRSRLR